MLVLLIVLALAAVAFVKLYLPYRRRTVLAAWAGRRGWAYRKGDGSLLTRWPGLPFTDGAALAATDVISGEHHGRAFVTFDLTQRNGSGEDATIHRYTVTTLGLPAALPMVQVTKETSTGRMETRFGLKERLPVDPEFDREHRVRSDDEAFAREVLHPGLIGALLARRGQPGGWDGWRIDGDTIITWNQRPLDTDAIDGRLDLLDTVVAQLPPAVWQRYGQGGR